MSIKTMLDAGKYSILIVEDEKPMLDAILFKMKGEGYSTMQARDGVEGLNLALTQHPHLILLDLMLPEMDGVTLLENLRKDSWGKKVKVILLTNLELDDYRLEKVIQNQPSYYLIKSDCTLELVLEKVKDVLSSIQ